MQHQPNSYEVPTQDTGYSQGRHIASDAIRGFAVGVRGVLEGRKLRREAKDDRERRFADEAYRQKVMDLQERQITLDDAFRTQQHEDVAGIQDRLTKVEEGKYDHEAHMYKLMVEDKAEQATLQREHETALTELQAAQQKGNIEATAAAQIKVDASKAKLDAVENRIQHREQMLILDKQGVIVTDQTRVAGDEARKTQEVVGDQAVEQIEKTGEEQRQTDTNRIQQEGNAKLLLESLKRIASTGADGMVALDDDEWGRYKAIFTETRQLQAVKDMADIAQGYQTAMQGYVSAMTGGETRTILEQRIAASVGKTPEEIQAEIDANQHILGEGFTMADMAMINGYQRMIDPGATVREGDVGALLSALGAGGQLQAMWVSVLEGGRFTEASRTQLASIVLDNYRTNLRNTWAVAAQPIQSLIERAGLKASNVNMQEFLPGWIDLAGVLPQDIVNTRDPYAGKLNARDDGRVPAPQTTEANTIMPEPAKAKLIEGLVEFARPIYETDPNFDEADQQQLRDTITKELQRAETQLKLPANVLVDKYAEELFKEVLEELSITTPAAKPEGGEPAAGEPEGGEPEGARNDAIRKDIIARIQSDIQKSPGTANTDSVRRRAESELRARGKDFSGDKEAFIQGIIDEILQGETP